MLKKMFFISVFTLLISADPIYAETSFLSLSIPVLHPGFQFDIAGLALKPSASNLNYVIYNKGLPLQSPNWTELEINPGYAAGVELGMKYLFTEGNDISLSWAHLNSHASSSVIADSNYFLGPDYEIGPIGIPIRDANSTVTFKYDVVNLDAGQFLNFGQHVVVRFFGGLSTGFLRENVNTTYSGNTVTGPYQGPFSTNQDVIANFTGAGPRLGVKINYNAHYGFSFLGEVATSALIGTSYSKTSYISSAQQLKDLYNQNYNYQTIKDQNSTQVVPGFDGKLGINYQYNFKKGALLLIEAGYQAAVYINAINQYLPASLVPDQGIETGGIFVATMSHTQSNYSVQGPFLKTTLQF